MKYAVMEQKDAGSIRRGTFDDATKAALFMRELEIREDQRWQQLKMQQPDFPRSALSTFRIEEVAP